ncbi:MAG TPA: rRNA maturation RNase YbeY [Candidatus Acidoferrum sp.]|nr:rRNA maturation RNase YbeY [Candidatus Acidoferrum sp.]
MVIVQEKVAGLGAESLRRFVARARKAAGLHGKVNVLITTDSAMRSLNSQFRSKDKPTDVLSFPAVPGQRNHARLAGELAISAEIAAQNAIELGHSPAAEVKVLVLHGILHLAGYDHARDNGRMARKEAKLRRALNLPIALIERSRPAHPKRRRRLGRAG